jgi:hypothetical protein
MDVNKLYLMVMASDEVKDVPILHIMKVLYCVLELIGSGECFYENE